MKGQAGIEAIIAVTVLLIVLAGATLVANQNRIGITGAAVAGETKNECWRFANLVSEALASGKGTQLTAEFPSTAFTVIPSSRVVSAKNTIEGTEFSCTLPSSRVSLTSHLITRFGVGPGELTFTNVGELVVLKLTTDDDVPPVITILAPPANETLFFKNVFTELSLNEEGSYCTVSVDAGAQQDMSTNDLFGWSRTVAVNGNGTHTLLFTCADLAGNLASASRTFSTGLFSFELSIISAKDTTQNYLSPYVLTSNDLQKFNNSENNRYESQGTWPNNVMTYDPEEYIEFVFGTNLNTTFVIEDVIILHEYMVTAKDPEQQMIFRIMRSDGQNYDFNVTRSKETNVDTVDIDSIYQFVNQPQHLQNLTIRFTSYTPSNKNYRTKHDHLKLIVNYYNG